MNQDPIFQKIDHATPVDFGGILSKSFELFKKVWVEALLHALVSIAIFIPFLIIIYAPLLPFYAEMIQNIGNPNYNPDNLLEGYGIEMIIGWAVLVFIIAFLIQPLAYSITGHFMQHCKKIDMGDEEPIGSYIDIAKKHFGKLFLLSLATMGIAIVAALLCYLPLFYVIVPLTLLLPVFVFNSHLSVGDIIKASFKLGNKYWLMVFGLMIVSSIISSLGMIFCFIGILVTTYYQYIVTYYFYKDSVGFDN